MEEEMKQAASQQVSESASQPEVVDGALGIVATEDESHAVAIADLDRRIQALEAAIGGVRSVKASGAPMGRKTSPAAGVDGALSSLSVEQRIAVKSGLMRVGLL